MGPVQGFFATSGIGGLIGGLVGWGFFALFASPDPSCVPQGDDSCLKMWNLSFLPFVTGVAALGGVIGLIVQLERDATDAQR